MIIKATRISTASGAGQPGGYMFGGSKGNDHTECLQGTREDIDDMVADAKRHGATYSIRHVIISPEQATTREQALDQVRRYAREFGADAERAVIVEHAKQREDAAGFERHWHAMLPEVDGGRVMDSSWMRARHEKLSRVAEIELGHHLVPGRWNAAVERALRAAGREDLALRVAPLAQGARPVASYTSDEHQVARRAGLSMPHTKATATAAAAALWASADGGQAFAAALAEHGLRLTPGTKPGVTMIQGRGGDGEWCALGAVHRMIKADRAEVAERLAGVDFTRAFEHARAGRDAQRPADEPVPGAAHIQEATPEAAAEGAAGPAGERVEGTPSPEPPPVEIVPAGEAQSPAAPAAPPAPAGGEAAPAAPAPSAPLSSGGGGGGGGGGTGSDEAVVEALDPTRPGDLARFLAQMAAADKRKERRLAAVDDSVSKAAQAKAAEAAKAFGERIREFFEAAADQHNMERTEHNGGSERTTTQSGHPGSDPSGHSVAGGRSQDSEYLRPQRVDPGQLRSTDGGPEHGVAAGAEVAVGSSEGGGAVPNGLGPRPSGTDRVEPDARGANAGGEQGVPEVAPVGAARSAGVGGPAREPGAMRARAEQHDAAGGADIDAARIGIRKRREVQHFAASAGRRIETLRQLIATIDGTPDRIAGAEARAQARAEARHARSERRKQIEAALNSSRQRVDAVLAKAPFPDPASRDPADLVSEERARAHRTVDEAKSQAQEARLAAAAARDKVGILGRIGLPTARRREAEAADLAAKSAEDRAQDAEQGLPHELRDAERRGAQRAETRQADQDRWDGSRDVQQARREEHGNRLVEAAIAGGDTDIEHLAADDLTAAREEMLRREAEQRQREEQARIERERQRAREVKHATPELEHAHGGPGGGAPAPGPRPR